MSNEKTYCGSGKLISGTGSNGEYKFLKLSFGPKDLQALNDNTNEKGWVNAIVGKKKEPGKYGETHYLTIDTFKPQPKGEQSSNKNQDDDLPF